MKKSLSWPPSSPMFHCWGCHCTTVYSMMCVWSWVARRPHPPPISPETRSGRVVSSPWAASAMNVMSLSGLLYSWGRLGWRAVWVCSKSVVEVMDSLGVSLSFQRWSWRAGDERSGQLLYLQVIFIFLHLSPWCQENWGSLTALSDWIHVKLISAR